MSTYANILDHLLRGESLEVETLVQPESIRRALYREAEKLKASMALLGMPLEVGTIKVVTIGVGKVHISATKRTSSLKILNTFPAKEKEENEKEL